jgi:hypothetical protein
VVVGGRVEWPTFRFQVCEMPVSPAILTDRPSLDMRREQLVDDDVAVMIAVKITPLDFVRLARSGRGGVYQAQ